MALNLKSRSQYADPRNGNLIENPYAVVTNSKGNSRLRQQQLEINIYRNKSAFTEAEEPLETRAYRVEGDAFDEFFSPAVLSATENDPYTASEEYLLQLRIMTAEPLEDGEEAPLEWGLWQKA